MATNEDDPRSKWTQNQVVAHNLRRARELRGWTQERAAEELEPYLGVRWSKANFSAAERSVMGKRIRQFSADEIFALAQAFGLPVAWFFLPPDDKRYGPEVGQAIETVVGDRRGVEEARTRLSGVFRRSPDERLTEKQEEYLERLDLSASSMVQAVLPDSAGIAATLIEAAKFIEELPKNVKKASNIPGASKASSRKRRE